MSKRRVERLTRKYQKYTSVAKARVLAKCVVDRRGGYGLFRSFGVPTKKERGRG
jgi:hypothetical protein